MPYQNGSRGHIVLYGWRPRTAEGGGASVKEYYAASHNLYDSNSSEKKAEDAVK